MLRFKNYGGMAACALFLAAAAIAEIGLGPQGIDRRDPGFQDRAGSLFYKGRLFSGVVLQRYENGSLYLRTRYHDGLRDGEAREFALNGRVRAISRYRGGRREGTQVGWFVEGPKRYEYHYRNGLLDGTQTEWHPNGAIFRQEIFSAGVETDKKVFYANGHAFTNYAKRGGRLYGLDGGSLCMETKKEGER